VNLWENPESIGDLVCNAYRIVGTFGNAQINIDAYGCISYQVSEFGCVKILKNPLEKVQGSRKQGCPVGLSSNVSIEIRHFLLFSLKN
jgi:hypothetical protein